ncbi:MAG TPA: hypothetical protein PKW80_00620 [Bacteroidales bacterium]|nr:hypothetical protein [Bacteroidales bacterium]
MLKAKGSKCKKDDEIWKFLKNEMSDEEEALFTLHLTECDLCLELTKQYLQLKKEVDIMSAVNVADTGKTVSIVSQIKEMLDGLKNKISTEIEKNLRLLQTYGDAWFNEKQMLPLMATKGKNKKAGEINLAYNKGNIKKDFEFEYSDESKELRIWSDNIHANKKVFVFGIDKPYYFEYSLFEPSLGKYRALFRKVKGKKFVVYLEK